MITDEFGPDAILEPIYPDLDVQKKFFHAGRQTDNITTFTYHGTKQTNIASISDIGLLMPGKNGHAVANGSADGTGISVLRKLKLAILGKLYYVLFYPSWYLNLNSLTTTQEYTLPSWAQPGYRDASATQTACLCAQSATLASLCKARSHQE